MLNPKLEILVTDAHIKFLISCRAHNETENVDLTWVYDELKYCLTDRLGTLGEDYGEKVLPGLRCVAWNIHSDPTKYTLSLYFSFPAGSLKSEDYCGVIKLFLPDAVVPVLNPSCMKKSYLWRLVLTSSADKFLQRSLAGIGPVLDFILALSVPSPVFAAMSGTKVAAPDTLVALSAAADDTESDEKYHLAPKAPAAVVAAAIAAAAVAQTFFRRPRVELNPVDEGTPLMPMRCKPPEC